MGLSNVPRSRYCHIFTRFVIVNILLIWVTIAFLMWDSRHGTQCDGYYSLAAADVIHITPRKRKIKGPRIRSMGYVT